MRAEIDDRNEKIGFKIREWEIKKVPYMLVVGKKESAGDNVSVRQHRKGDLGAVSREEFLRQVQKEITEKKVTL